MLKSKWKIILGIAFLIVGIFLKLHTDYQTIAIVLMALGGLLKLINLIHLLKKKTYKAGWEIAILVIGLSLFFFGLYVCQIESYARLFIIFGLLLKLSFVVLFVRKLKK
jgi:membrane protein insertase Oxa1/YidC/SpoIIIJ